MRIFCSFVLVAEALGTLVIWALLWRDPTLGAWFLPPDVAPELIWTFVGADMLTFVALPLAAGHGVFHGCRWAGPALWLHAGGVLYAAVLAISLTVATGAGLACTLLSVPVAALAVWFAVWASRSWPHATE